LNSFSIRLWFQHNFNAISFLLIENFVAIRGILNFHIIYSDNVRAWFLKPEVFHKLP
jgi:hypothetical protein